MNTIPENGMQAMQAVIAGMCSVSYLYFGFYILSPALKEKRIRPLLYVCVFSAIWSFSYVLYFLSSDPYMKDIWQRFTFAGLLTFTFGLLFLIKYTALIKNKKVETILSIAIWLPPLLSVYKSLSGNAIARDFPFGFWYLFAEIQTTVYNLATIVFILMYYFGNKTHKSRRQTFILTGSGIMIITVSWLADYFFGYKNIQNINSFWLLIWIGILLFTIKKYRFISMMPEFIGTDISENIEEGIILLDPGLKINFANNALRRLLNIGDDEKIELHDIISEKHVFEDELLRLAQNGRDSFRMQVNFVSKDSGTKLPVDIKVKKIIDAYKDLNGFLMIASRAKDIDHLKSKYGISAREMDVIRQLALGRANKDMAAFLNIKESTVETHITSIYNKLGIKNRIELLNVLSGFNLPN